MMLRRKRAEVPVNLYLIFQKHFDEVMPAWVVERYREQHGKKTN